MDPSSSVTPSSPLKEVCPSPTPSSRGRRKATVPVAETVGEEMKEEVISSKETKKKNVRKGSTCPPLISEDHKHERVCVLLTGYQRDSRIEKLVRDIGGDITNEPSSLVTHCITTPELKRTPKLLMSINYGAYVITLDWLEDSAKLGRPIPLLLNEENDGDGGGDDENTSKKYIVHDSNKERQWNFQLYATLQQSRRRAGSLLSQLSIYITKGVCGNNAPKADEMKNIILSGGGIWLSKLPGKRNQIYDSSMDETSSSTSMSVKPIVISSSEVANKEVTSSVMEFAKTGRGKGIYSIEFLFLAILRYHVDYETGILEGYRF